MPGEETWGVGLMDRVSVLRDEKVLEMASGDGCPTL